MKLTARKSRLSGAIRIPGSKSHTVRAVAIASLAEGTSRIREPLVASDTLSALDSYELLGARVARGDDWTVSGVGGKPQAPDRVIDVGNSGTTLYIALGSAALAEGNITFDGDEQIRRRPAQPLLDALSVLGATAESTRGNGLAPIIVRGPMTGGSVLLDGSKTSQYLTSLLINCPLAKRDTTIEVQGLVEKPYVEMTLKWLEEQGIRIEHNLAPSPGGEGWGEGASLRFHIPGGQSYRPFDTPIPADWSSATFFMCAAAITGSDLALRGLDINDTQGDKAVADMLARMGAQVVPVEDGLHITGDSLTGAEFDLGNTPDALPALAVTACFAKGETRLVNVAQARLKETDRISVMREELSKLGADIQEMPDGLIVRGAMLHAGQVNGHSDHRVIMALAMAGLALDGETTVSTAEALNITFPNFVELMAAAGGDMSVRTDS